MKHLSRFLCLLLMLALLLPGALAEAVEQTEQHGGSERQALHHLLRPDHLRIRR